MRPSDFINVRKTNIAKRVAPSHRTLHDFGNLVPRLSLKVAHADCVCVPRAFQLRKPSATIRAVENFARLVYRLLCIGYALLQPALEVYTARYRFHRVANVSAPSARLVALRLRSLTRLHAFEHIPRPIGLHHLGADALEILLGFQDRVTYSTPVLPKPPAPRSVSLSSSTGTSSHGT